MDRWTVEETAYKGSVWERPAGDYVRYCFSKGMGPPTESELADAAIIEELKKQGYVLYKAEHGRQWSEITYFKARDA